MLETAVLLHIFLGTCEFIFRNLWFVLFKIYILCYNPVTEGSRDTEDWSNDAENSALRHRNKLYFKVY